MQYNIIPVPCSVKDIKGTPVKPSAFFDVKGMDNDTLRADIMAFFDRVSGNIGAKSPDSRLIIELVRSNGRPEEGYAMTVDGTVKIFASSASGFFYGVQTLKQLIFDYWIKHGSAIPALEIEDAPLYGYRGYMLDVSRHFFSVETVLRLLDVLALHKINKFHFHITDDQGWRLQIRAYPMLTQAGAFRKHTTGDATPHGGFYTQDDIKKIVEYAASKHIEVIPEIDLPGHFTAAIASYPELSCEGKPIEVATSFGIKTDIACAGKEETYTFFEKVIDELAELFSSGYIHIGGDEAPKTKWNACAHCGEQMKKQSLDNVEKLQGYMVNRIAAYAESKGKKVIVWNESLNSGMLKDSVICQYWSDGKQPLRVLKGMREGRKTVISKFTPYYLDYPYGMHSLKAVYSFAPELNAAQESEQSIIGLESPLWTEYVVDEAAIHYQTFPRLTALSEIAWSPKTHRDYEDFEERLKEFYPIYGVFGITPAPIERVNPNRLKGILQVASFFWRALSWESVKALISSYKAAKEVKAGRETVD